MWISHRCYWEYFVFTLIAKWFLLCLISFASGIYAIYLFNTISQTCFRIFTCACKESFNFWDNKGTLALMTKSATNNEGTLKIPVSSEWNVQWLYLRLLDSAEGLSHAGYMPSISEYSTFRYWPWEAKKRVLKYTLSNLFSLSQRKL